ncbi:MAG: hypothetical protein PVF87_12010 [Acidimicrobiia bacterium]
MDEELRVWLLDGDPSIVWQVERDLLDLPEATWASTQSRVATEGWGARLLSERSPDGRWADGLYGPKWKSTTYTLLQLWRMGLSRTNPEALASTALLLDKPVWRFGVGRDECVAGFGLSLSSWFTIDDDRRDDLVISILEQQLDDGGWNCRHPRTGSTHGSFHTTINVAEGLREYVLSGGRRSADVMAAERRAMEFFGAHRLYRSHRSAHIPDERMTRMPFPPRWHHDVLRGLDWLRAAEAPRDERLQDPVDVVMGHRRKDGRWPIHANYSGEVWFRMESGRAPSRWNTLRALRVARWWAQAVV